MFLTTEPSLTGKNYNALRIVYATKTKKANFQNDNTCSYDWDTAIENALGKLHANATNLGAYGVISVHISTSVTEAWVSVTVMGTAIKFV